MLRQVVHNLNSKDVVISVRSPEGDPIRFTAWTDSANAISVDAPEGSRVVVQSSEARFKAEIPRAALIPATVEWDFTGMDPYALMILSGSEKEFWEEIAAHREAYHSMVHQGMPYGYSSAALGCAVQRRRARSMFLRGLDSRRRLAAVAGSPGNRVAG